MIIRDGYADVEVCGPLKSIAPEEGCFNTSALHMYVPYCDFRVLNMNRYVCKYDVLAGRRAVQTNTRKIQK